MSVDFITQLAELQGQTQIIVVDGFTKMAHFVGLANKWDRKRRSGYLP